MMHDDVIHGGCLCGALRYAARGAVQTTICHCEDCRRASGAPFVAWTFFPAGSLVWTRGVPKVLKFADRERSFCGECGTPLVFVDPSIPAWFEITTCSFDDPSLFPPGDHCWIVDRIPWLDHLESLPVFPHASPLPGES